jgi:hypothetical protein
VTTVEPVETPVDLPVVETVDDVVDHSGVES